MAEKLLEVSGLKKYYPIKKNLLGKPGGYVQAVNGVDFSIRTGETLGLVGESGCGKSTVGKCIIGLENVTEGSVALDGVVLSGMPERQRRKRRRDIQMVFQNPYASLNQRRTIQQIIDEPMQVNLDLSRQERLKRTKELLRMVGLREEYCSRYPHEFSGGQRQRIAIARALAVDPRLVIADEAVSALDVSIQSQVINLFKELQEKLGLTYLFISHNLCVVKYISDRIGVMYLGEMVEMAETEELFQHPCHPYTRSLLSAIPLPDVTEQEEARRENRIILQGDVPSPANPPEGCRFHTRCPLATERCAQEKPCRTEVAPGHTVTCHLCGKGGGI